MNRNHILVKLILITSISLTCYSCSIRTSSGGQLKDVEGNTYRTIQIGEQFWMAEDLKTTCFADGTPIPEVENYEEWASLTLPAYSWYNNDSLSSESFGVLYNYYVVETGKLCPDGWHVPTDEDWIALEAQHGDAGLAGGHMKETGTALWKTPNAYASNNSGFTARPGGYRSYNGTFNLKRIDGFWWTSTEKSWYGSTSTVLYRNLTYDDQALIRNVAEKNNGFSVRCVKNQE